MAQQVWSSMKLGSKHHKWELAKVQRTRLMNKTNRLALLFLDESSAVLRWKGWINTKSTYYNISIEFRYSRSCICMYISVSHIKLYRIELFIVPWPCHSLMPLTDHIAHDSWQTPDPSCAGSCKLSSIKSSWIFPGGLGVSFLSAPFTSPGLHSETYCPSSTTHKLCFFKKLFKTSLCFSSSSIK